VFSLNPKDYRIFNDYQNKSSNDEESKNDDDDVKEEKAKEE
jgi:hypothetical protein